MSSVGNERAPFHELKIWPEFYDMITAGTKQFELRKNDRDFRLNDILWLREWNPESEEYTGYHHCVQVVTFFADLPGLADGYVLMGISRL